MARSINSPGVQITETDLSTIQEFQGGTSIFVAGFTPQGPIDDTLLITSISEFEQVYGIPQTPAERYFYHTCKEVLNSPANLLTSRLPYGSGSGEGFANQYSALLFPVSIQPSASAYDIGEPKYLSLNEDEYNKLIQGETTWAPVTSDSNTANYNNGVITAGIVILNSSQTAANEFFEGYYVSLTDNSEFGPNSDFTAVTRFYGLTSNDSSDPFYTVPTTRLGFSLSASKESIGSNSISETIEGTVNFDLSQSFYNDTLLLNVFRIRNSIYEPQTLTFSLVETHLGSLDSNKKTASPGGGIPRTFFLEDVVNESSRNIKVLVNPNLSKNKNWVNPVTNDPVYSVRLDGDVKAVYPKSVYMPKFEFQTQKEVGNIVRKVERALTLVESVETIDIDVVVDGGLTTIFTNVSGTGTGANFSGESFDDEAFQDITQLENSSSTAITRYKTIFNVFNNFVSNNRKDCVFIADPLRQVFVNGKNTKVLNLRPTTFSQNIYKPLKNLFDTANSNYAITYGNWVKGYDSFSDKQVWLPISGFAAAAYARTDEQAQPWAAPAGLTRGTLSNVIDLAFNPNQKQRDFLYTISINPVVFFSGDGYTLFGQKTLQNKPSAFDRVNVRRLFLSLERAVRKALKFYVFEPNTSFTRDALINTISPVFELAKNTEGLFDYLIVCDERNNTPEVIDRNELAVDIYIKPVRTAEFILVNFIATRTGQDFNELI